MKIVKRTKEIALISTSFFTVLTLAFCGLAAAGASAFGEENMTITQFADNSFVFFLYSVVFGLSFLVFDVKALPKPAKRLTHMALNYAAMVFFLFFMATLGSPSAETADDLVSAAADGRAGRIFAASFLFLALYFAGMLVSYLIRRFLKGDKYESI